MKAEDGHTDSIVGPVPEGDLRPAESPKALLWGHAAKLRRRIDQLERQLEIAHRDYGAVVLASQVLGLAPCPF